MRPGSYSFTIYQGATFQRTLTWHDGDQDADPVDLTDWSAAMQIRDAKDGDGELLVSLSDAVDGGITLGGVAGTIEIVIDAEATAAMDLARQGYYDLELTDPDGAVVWRLLEGRVGFSREVTVEEGS